MPELSVIVTCYNIEKYIEQCLRSVCDQSLSDLEIIVVDDGSTDATREIICRFAAEDPRIIPILFDNNTPGGVASAANAGLDRSSAPYVGFVDGDDFCEPRMFARLLDSAKEHDTDLAMCRYKLLDEGTGELSDPADHQRWALLDQPRYVLGEEEQKRLLRFVAVPWRKIYRRSMLEANQIRFPVGDYFYEDNPFHWYAILSSSSIAVVPEVLCYHRVARAGQTMATLDSRLFRIFAHHDTIQRWLVQQGLSDEFNPSLVAWVVSQLEWISQRTPRSLRRELFDTLKETLGGYDSRVIQQGLREGNKGKRARALVGAIRDDNYAAFVRTLDRGVETNSIVNGLYYLRYAGIEDAARMSQRHMRDRYQRIRDHEGISGRDQDSLKRAEAFDHRDLMFALTVLDRRLDRIESQLQRLDGKID